MNVYHTPQYQAYRQKCGSLYSEKYRSSLPGKTWELAEGYSVQTDYYEGYLEHQIRVARHQLLDSTGQAVYTWDNLDFDGEFCTLISHANGRRYLIFRENLYGYSVLEIETGQALHYIPEKSWPLDGRPGQETFIWSGVSYDAKSNLLAVFGCYWASTNDTLFLDFSDPMQIQDCGQWLEMHCVVDADYNWYDDIDLERFGADGLLYFRALSAEDGTRADFVFPVERILELVQRKREE